MTFNPTDNAHFVLYHVKDAQWLIQDTNLPPTDPEHTIAFVELDENDLATVVWLRDVPLPPHYATAEDALTDLRIWATGAERSTRPIDIPHMPPTTL